MDTAYDQIIEPQRIAFSFTAPGWYFLGASLLLLTALLCWRLYQIRKSNRYRRDALALLLQCQNIYEINMLLKQIAMSICPRSSLAPVRGTEWINFLNRMRRKTLFTSDDVQLITGLYKENTTLDKNTSHRHGFERKAREWIKKHYRET